MAMSCEFYHCKFSEIVMETNDTQEIEVNDELRGMLSGNFDDTRDEIPEMRLQRMKKILELRSSGNRKCYGQAPSEMLCSSD